MRLNARIVLGLLLLGLVLVPIAMATSGDRAVPSVQTAVVNFTEPTRIGDAIVMGPVVIVHDDRMYLHEPCTDGVPIRAGRGRAGSTHDVRVHSAQGGGSREVHDEDGPRSHGGLCGPDGVPVRR